MPTDLAYISPNLLRWARERSRLTGKEVAERSALKLEKIRSWEEGEKQPTLRQAQRLARTLRVPFGYLFLSSPPTEHLQLPDLRRLAESQLGISIDFRDLLSDVLFKQQWYREYLVSEGLEPLAFIGSTAIEDDIDDVADSIRRALGMDDNFRRQASNWGEFLGDFIEQVESLRILVLRSGIVKNDTSRKLSVEEFRGFVITDDVAPLIFLNAKDSKAAQIFTLAHELVHLWIGRSGISNPNLASPEITSNHSVETFCNRVAAELLVPAEWFLTEWNQTGTGEEKLRRLSKVFKVSSLVILRRAFDLRKINWVEYRAQYRREVARFQSLPVSTGGNFYATIETRNGRELARAVLSENLEGRLLARDAARLLGLRVDKLEKAASRLGIIR